jgi:hypothetical protein
MLYDVFMVPFSIALEFDFYGGFYVVDMIAIVVYCVDIYMRAKTAITTPDNLCLDQNRVMRYYINSWLAMDLLACIPFEYFLYPVHDGY